MPKDGNDIKLFQKIMEGDEKSFDSLFLKYYTPLCRFAYVYLKDESESEEIVQEMFIHLWENRKRLEIHTSVFSYFCASVKNKAFNYIQKNKTRKLHENNAANQVVTEFADIIDDLTINELQAQLCSIVDKLPKKCREIFHLSRNKNMSNAEIASHLGVSVKTVENQITIALKKIKSNLPPYLFLILLIINHK